MLEEPRATRASATMPYRATRWCSGGATVLGLQRRHHSVWPGFHPVSRRIGLGRAGRRPRNPAHRSLSTCATRPAHLFRCSTDITSLKPNTIQLRQSSLLMALVRKLSLGTGTASGRRSVGRQNCWVGSRNRSDGRRRPGVAEGESPLRRGRQARLLLAARTGGRLPEANRAGRAALAARHRGQGPHPTGLAG